MELAIEVSMSSLVAPHIELHAGPRGLRPRVAGKGTLVQAIVAWHQLLNMSPDDIAATYELTLAEVHAALTYYYDHREEMDRSNREDQDFVEDMKQLNPSLLQERLRKRFGV